jgi:Tfp pilus tip-associated adhesin PilY1
LLSTLAHLLTLDTRGANYTDKGTLFGIFDDVMVTKSADAACAALMYGAIATGSQLERLHSANKSRKASIAQWYFEKALGILPRPGAKSSIAIFKVGCLGSLTSA